MIGSLHRPAFALPSNSPAIRVAGPSLRGASAARDRPAAGVAALRVAFAVAAGRRRRRRRRTVDHCGIGRDAAEGRTTHSHRI